MAIDTQAQRIALRSLSEVDGIAFDPEWLAENVHLLAETFPDMEEFTAAAVSTKQALERVAAQTVDVAQLSHNLNGWQSYHYQHRRAQKAKADMRIVFKREDDLCYIMGFGHRRIPADVYRRLAEGRTL